jgi:hypothetical protein
MKRPAHLASLLYGKNHSRLNHPAIIPAITPDGFVFNRIVNYSPDFMKAEPHRAPDAGTQGKEEIHIVKENTNGT